MEFEGHKPIYIQISDSICDKIISGVLKTEDRIPSVRELGADIGVNPNTIVRSFDYLQSLEIIYNKRGIGYFVSTNAKEIILATERKQFMNNDLPLLFKKMEQLSISIETLIECHKLLSQSS